MQIFNLKIDGHNVSPETVKLGDLLDTLACVRKAIIASAVDSGKTKESVFLSLQNIQKKCNLLTIGENEEAHIGRIRVAKAIRHRDLSLVPQQARKELRHLWSKAATRSWTIAFQNSEPEATIDPLSGVPAEKYLKGNTSIFAYVVRVGGDFPTALVTLPTGKKLTVTMADPIIAKQLGERLYQHVVLNGVARWYRGTQKLAHFRVTSLGAYNDKRSDPSGAMAALAKIMGHHWQGVDADSYLSEERSE